MYILSSLTFLSFQPAKYLPRTLYLRPEPKNLMCHRTNIHLKTKTVIVEMFFEIFVQIIFFQFWMKHYTFSLTFRGPCIVSIFWYISDKMQRYTVCFWKLLYMFPVVSPPVIRSTPNCVYNIWYLSNRYCYLPL